MHIIHWGRDYNQGRCHNRRALAAVAERHELPSVLRHAHLRGGAGMRPFLPMVDGTRPCVVSEDKLVDIVCSKSCAKKHVLKTRPSL